MISSDVLLMDLSLTYRRENDVIFINTQCSSAFASGNKRRGRTPSSKPELDSPSSCIKYLADRIRSHMEMISLCDLCRSLGGSATSPRYESSLQSELLCTFAFTWMRTCESPFRRRLTASTVSMVSLLSRSSLLMSFLVKY